jgi:epoxyqueuosine reductase QueG
LYGLEERVTLKDDIKRWAQEHDLDLVGFASTERLNQVTPTKYTPKRLWPEAKTAISIGRHLLIAAAEVGITDSVQNARWIAWRTADHLSTRAIELGHFLERQGVRALPLSAGNMTDPDWDNQGIFGELSHRHIAAQAGLGVIGVPTFCITPQYGPRVYFNTILTTAELEPDPLLDWNPCGDTCDECIRACPGEALARGRRTIRKMNCIPYAMPHGVRAAQNFLLPVVNGEDAKARETALRDFQFMRLHRATVLGVGTIAGCFYCLQACPIGKPGTGVARPLS